MDLYEEGELDRIERSWFRQSRNERRARLHVITELVLALDTIRKVSTFAIRLGESAIEAIIEGDFVMVAQWAEHLSWKDELPELRQQRAELWQPFVKILQTELRRRSTN